MKKLKVSQTYIIAEAGVNHNGDIRLAKELITAAKDSGADAVKFQSFKASRVISKFADKASYQRRSERDSETQLEMLSKLELQDGDYEALAVYAKKQGIVLLSTPKDIISARFLETTNMPFYKIGSTEINNFDFLKYIASTHKPIILSTGMSTLGEVESAINVIREVSDIQIILLHCVSQYPCEIAQVNLRAMDTMASAFKCIVGYSDHTIGSDVVLAAVARGAKVIEKHFTLDKNMEGPDHKVSMEPNELKRMIKSIRNIEMSMGNGIKKPAPCEMENVQRLRRGLVFSRPLAKGMKVGAEEITIKRPGIGLEPKYKKIIENMVLKKDVSVDEPVTWDVFY